MTGLNAAILSEEKSLQLVKSFALILEKIPTAAFSVCFDDSDFEEKIGKFINILGNSMSKLNDGNRRPVLSLLARISNNISEF